MTISAGRFYSAVALICGSVMSLQILQSRLFSVITWYHLSFLVISIAMFGLTLGALTVYRGDQAEQRRNLSALLSKTSRSYGLWAVVALAVQLTIPIVRDSLASVIFTLPSVAAVTAVCYFYAGKAVSLCLTRSPFPVGRIYAADMAGASGGCLAALALMHVMSAPSAVLLVAGLAIVTAILLEPPQTRRWAVLAAALILAGLGNATMAKPVITPLFTKGLHIARAGILYERWNTISRIIVMPEFPNKPIFLWGPSPKLPADAAMDYKYLMVDGAAGTPITKFDGHDFKPVRWLEYDVTNIAHVLPGIDTMAIIGVGGGRDLLSALYFGVKHVVAIDINNIQVGLLTTEPQFRGYSNLWNQPGVEIVNSEARSWLTRHPETFDMVQMSLIDTWTSAGAGAFALTENGLYTVNAWKIFLGRLNDHGVLTVSRWHFQNSWNDLGRLASMTVAALLDMGEPAPWKNVFIAHSDHIATIVIGRHPLTDAQLDALHGAAEKYGYDILASPRLRQDNVVNRILHAGSRAEIAEAVAGLPFDLNPPTDQRPFFFNQARIGRPFEVIGQALSKSMAEQNLAGHAVATVNLYLIFLLACAASLLVLVLPFRGALRDAPARFIHAGSAYFTLIGLGFMFVEIALMQIMSLFLGHPIYGLGIVLFSLILSTGAGSFLSDYILLSTPARLVAWSLALAAYIAGLSFMIDPLLNVFIEADLPERIGICVMLLVPCGVLMGFAFPAGMRLTAQVSDRLTPWFWGINGTAGVVASALALIIGIGWGLNVTLLAGACCYALLGLAASALAGGKAVSNS